MNATPGSLQMGDAVAIIRGQGKSLRRKEKRARIEQIRAKLGLSDSQKTPMVLLDKLIKYEGWFSFLLLI